MSEGDGSLKLCAILVRGIPTELAKFTLTTVDGGAAGMLDLNLLSSCSCSYARLPFILMPCHYPCLFV